MRTPDNKTSAEIKKINLEREKLEIEIVHLKSKWHKFIIVLIPIGTVLIGAIGLIFTFTSGIIDVRKAELENKKSLLEIEIANFKKTKDSIKTQTEIAGKTLDSLTNANKKLIEENKRVLNYIKFLKVKYGAEKSQINNELLEIERISKTGNCSEASKRLNILINKLNLLTIPNIVLEMAEETFQINN